MDEDVWETYDHRTKKGANLRRTDPKQYELIVEDDYNTASIDLDRKHLKDLFNAIGNEIGAF